MARTDDRRAASMFFAKQEIGVIPGLTPAELNAQLSPRDAEKLRRGEPPTIGIAGTPRDAHDNMRRIRDWLRQSDAQDPAAAMQQRHDDLTRDRDQRGDGRGGDDEDRQRGRER